MNYDKYSKLYTEDEQCQFCGKYDIPPYKSKAWGYEREDYSMVCDGIQTWGPDPFAEEIHGDHSDYFMCDGERWDSGQSI